MLLLNRENLIDDLQEIVDNNQDTNINNDWLLGFKAAIDFISEYNYLDAKKCTIPIKIGYITRHSKFEYQELEAIRYITNKKDYIKIPDLYDDTYNYSEVEDNTDIFNNTELVVVSEPFFTNDKIKKRCELWCTNANSVENEGNFLLNTIED